MEWHTNMKKIIAPLVFALALVASVSGQTVLGGSVSVGGAATTDIFSASRPIGTLAYSKLEYQTVTAGSTQTLLNYASGDGYVSEMLIAIICSGDALSCTDSTIKVYENGSGAASISLPLYQFMGSKYIVSTSNHHFNSQFITASGASISNGVSYQFMLPIPFTGGVKIDLVNVGSASMTLFSTIAYHTGVPNTWNYTRHLKVGTLSTGSAGCSPNSTVTLMDDHAVGVPGRFFGLWLQADGFINSVSSRPAPLEGDLSIYLDGSGTSSYTSSGTEDYFGMGFYGANYASENSMPGSWHGTAFWDNTIADNTWSFYRFHQLDPIVFSSGLKITWQCGDTSQASFTGNPVVWATTWYYAE